MYAIRRRALGLVCVHCSRLESVLMSPRFIGTVVPLLGNGITICCMILVTVRCLSSEVDALHCREGETAPKRNSKHVSNFFKLTDFIKDGWLMHLK